MKILLWVGAALLLPLGASAQAFVSAPATFSQPLGSPGATPAGAAGAPYYTRLVAGGGSITYFGSVCTQNCQHEQFAQLRRAFETTRPTVVFFEKPDMGVDSTETATISHLGEAAYVRYLAQQHEVPAERLDDPVAEYEYLQTRLDPEHLKLLCLLRESYRFRVRVGSTKALTKRAMQELLTNSAYFLPGTERVIRNMAELEVAYRTYMPAGSKWWEAPAGWFNPALPTGRVSNAAIESFREAVRGFREQTMYGKLAEKAQGGQRVFVVINRDYLPLARIPLARK